MPEKDVFEMLDEKLAKLELKYCMKPTLHGNEMKIWDSQIWPKIALHCVIQHSDKKKSVNIYAENRYLLH